MSSESPVGEFERPTTTERGRNPYLFVVGCQRSGTTMLQRMLDAHPDLTVAYDSLFITRVIRGQPVGFDPPLSPSIADSACGHPRFSRLGLSDAAVARAVDRGGRYSEFVTAVYDELAAAQEKPLAGEKSPGYCRHLERLHALLPWARFVHLVRDGRDVALSIREWGKGAAKLELWRREPIAVGALWWRRDIRLGCGQGRALPTNRYREFRYERLVGEPEPTLREMAEFLGLPFSTAMLEYHTGKARYEPGLSAKAAWLPPTQGVRDWKSQMSDQERELFEAIAGRELEHLGYERSCDSISPSVSRLADECEAWWHHEMGSPGVAGER